MPRAILSFDLDGTLVDSVADIATALNRALAEVALAPHPVARVRSFVGSGARNLVLRALEAHGRADLVDDVLARFRAAYGANLVGETTVYPGVADALRALEDAGALVAVCTNKPGVYARPLVDALLPGCVALTLGPDDVDGALKPDAAMLAHAERTLGGRVLVHVGDSGVDVATARAHGVRAVGVAWGLGSRGELAGADDVVESPGDLVAILGPLLR